MKKNITEWDALENKAVFLYVLQVLGNTDILKIFKIIYFANKEYLHKYGMTVVKDTFVAMKNGPVPSFIYDAIKYAQKRNTSTYEYIDILKDCFEWDPDFQQNLYATQQADLDYIASAVKEELDESIAKYKDFSGEELSEKSHDEAWKISYDKAIAQGKKASKMEDLNIAQYAGASDETLQYIKMDQDTNRLILGM